MSGGIHRPQHAFEKWEALQKSCLEANGWRYGMWRWFWVWRKETHDASFICMSADAAMVTERALQSSSDCYPEAPKDTGSAS